MMDSVEARRLLVGCFEAAVAAVDPEEAVVRNLGPIEGRVVIFALGKGAPAMARGAARALGRSRLEGIVVSNHDDEVPDGLTFMLGSHPVPDARSFAAGSALLDLAGTLGDDDVALVLISGGGSALAEAPVRGVTLEDIAATNEVLLRSGADIVAVNTVRRRLSQFKAGGLAAAIHPARVISLAVSDVVGDDPTAIASGPTVPSGDAPRAAQDVVASLGIEPDLPPAVAAAFGDVAAVRLVPEEAEYRIIAGGAVAAHAAAAAASGIGVAASVVDTRMTGDAAETAGEVLRRAGRGLSVFAGETTVDVVGDGVGGRNQEAALTAATLIAGRPDVYFLSAGTDGIDGMTEAAGAMVDGGTVARARQAGLDPDRALDRNDSGTFFRDLGEQIVTGPTGTNVGDIWLVYRD
jgi:hydroxypyruvate reductase